MLRRERVRDRLPAASFADAAAVRELVRRRGLGTGRTSVGVVTSVSPLTVEVGAVERVVDLRYPPNLALASLTNYAVGDLVEVMDAGATVIGFKLAVV
jgi:hypothetical protein